MVEIKDLVADGSRTKWAKWWFHWKNSKSVDLIINFFTSGINNKLLFHGAEIKFNILT